MKIIIDIILKKILAHPSWAGVSVIVAIITLIVTIYPFKKSIIQDASNIYYVSHRINRGDFLGLSFHTLLPQERLEELPERLEPKQFFIDVQPQYKYAKELFYARNRGIISANPRYNPEEEIRKKEVAVILSNMICVALNNPTKVPNSCAKSYKKKPIPFKDLEDKKYEKLAGFKPYVNHLLKLGIIKPKSNFYPDSPITKDKANKLISKSKKLIDFYKEYDKH